MIFWFASLVATAYVDPATIALVGLFRSAATVSVVIGAAKFPIATWLLDTTLNVTTCVAVCAAAVRWSTASIVMQVPITNRR